MLSKCLVLSVTNVSSWASGMDAIIRSTESTVTPPRLRIARSLPKCLALSASNGRMSRCFVSGRVPAWAGS